MEFKYINDKKKTPIKRNVFSSTANCDSPFKSLSNFSTPPSRFTKIINPFEPHLLERLHLPTFSPSVFTKVSTPKSEEKFRWTIDEISSLRPADIDEETISQHVSEHDPHTEHVVQKKIETFFSSEDFIAPSPLTEVVRVPLITDTPEGVLRSSRTPTKTSAEATTQTVLTLPPTLPKHVEEVLRPYFTFTENQQQSVMDKQPNTLTQIYKNLFAFEDNDSPDRKSIESSPGLSTGGSPIHIRSFREDTDRRDSLPHDTSELRDCTLSPIPRKLSLGSRSACRLDFSSKSMSIDASMIVPDIGNQMTRSISMIEDGTPLQAEPLSDSTVNWDMEYKHVSLASLSSSSESLKMEITSNSNLNTPHSKIFTSQRKRLSDSFKDIEDELDEYEKANEEPSDNLRQSRKIFKNDTGDAGYHTGTGTFYEESLFVNRVNPHVFASTPSKKSNK